MSLTRVFQYGALAIYVIVTVAALVFTMTRVQLLPMSVMRFSYAMMAPYQTYANRNADLHAEGRAGSGAWQTIDLAPYYPYGHGEANLRRYLLLPRWKALVDGDYSVVNAQYRLIAQQLLAHERQKGMPYDHVRLLWEEWPVSYGGFEDMRVAPFMSGSIVATAP